MHVTFNGYISFICDSCNTPQTIEAKTLLFAQDTSPEAADDEYIRYLSQIVTPCPTCANSLRVNLDVWEHPEAVVNYSYYGELGVHNIQCEFNIEHYFDDETAEEDGSLTNSPEDESIHNDDDYDPDDGNYNQDDEDTQHNESGDFQFNLDQYDDEE